MNILKVGNTFLNLDNVAYMTINPTNKDGNTDVGVMMVGSTDDSMFDIMFKGDDAEALVRYLLRGVTDVSDF